MKALVFSEVPEMAAQMITYLRGSMDADAATTSQRADDLAQFGAGTVYRFTGKPQCDNVAKSLEEIYRDGYDYLFIASTILGREVAGFASQSLAIDIVPEIAGFEVREGKSVTKRFFLGGKTVLEEESGAKAFTFGPGITDPVKVEGKSEISEKTLPDSAIETLSVEEKQASGVNLEQAKVIVSIGRGLGKKEGISTVEPLVKAVNGELAGSRPVCLDYQWLGEERQVGISGKKVRPNLYIALGISGQIQHIAGMRGAKTVIAINKDKSAPIFEEADYGLVGDLYQIVPKLVQALSS